MSTSRRCVPGVLGVLFALCALSTTSLASLTPEDIRDVSTAGEAKAQMERIAASLPADDGLAPFNTMYIATTENIHAAALGGRFEKADFIERFIPTFANLYFAALRSYLAGGAATPLAWRPMFAAEHRLGSVKAVQLATAGMFAHIGRDLPVVVRTLFADRNHFPRHSSPEYHDYLVVNDILEATFDQIENELFADTVHTRCEGLWRGASNAFAIPSIKLLRAKAWIDGKALWTLRGVTPLATEYLQTLDFTVELAASTVFAARCEPVSELEQSAF